MHKKVMLSLNQETLDQIENIKERQNVNSTSELIRRLIEKEFHSMKKLIKPNQKEFQEFIQKSKKGKKAISDTQIKTEMARVDSISDASLETESRRASENK